MHLSKHPNVAIVGLGGWGEKLVRTGTNLGIPLHGFDLDLTRGQKIKHRYPTLTLHTSLKSIMQSNNIIAVVVATTPSTHYALAHETLLARKHVLIEKPMTQNVTQAQRLRTLAVKVHRIIMIDHTYLFSPALHMARQILLSGAIGPLKRIESVRLGSRALADSTVLWDFASHDVAIAQFLTRSNPYRVRTIAEAYTKGATLDDATIELTFSKNAARYLAHVSWSDPAKERTLTLTAESGTLALRWENGKETLIRYQKGKKTALKTPAKEPLGEMFRHFIQSITTNTRPVSNDETGYEVVRVVAALHESWKRNGAAVFL